MKILATVLIKGSKITQPWELIEDQHGSVLIIEMHENGDLMGIVLNNRLINDLKGHEIAERIYSGILDCAGAELIPRAGQSAN